jgi:carbonic anhydrase/acetyltransferase-like protein (isoleucine patch superfamily)
MPLYALGDVRPTIHPEAFVHPDAVVIGNVTIGADSTVWPGAVLRGDYGVITIGERTSVQDGTVIHATAAHPTVVGNSVTIGHLAHLEGCTIHDEVLIGNGAIVMHDVVVERLATVAAGCVVRHRTHVPSRALILGVPGVIREEASDLEFIAYATDLYVANGRRYRQELRQL